MLVRRLARLRLTSSISPTTLPKSPASSTAATNPLATDGLSAARFSTDVDASSGLKGAKGKKMSKQSSIASFFGAAAKKPAAAASAPAATADKAKQDNGVPKTADEPDKTPTEPAAKRVKPNPTEDEDVAVPAQAAAAAAAPAPAPAPAAVPAKPAAAAASSFGKSSSASAAGSAAAAPAAADDPTTVWEPVTDLDAHFKKSGVTGYHPLKEVDWPVTVYVSKGLKPGAPDASLAAPEGALRVDCPAIPYSALVKVFSEIEKTTKRLEITALLTNFFRSVILTSPDDLLPCLYLCTNTIAAPYENLELGVGDSLLMKALAEATGRQLKDVKAAADEKGDLGLVAETSRAQQRTLFAAAATSTKAAVSVRQVFAQFLSIARESGKSSQDKKVATIKKLLVTSNGTEAKYIIRSMQGKLRIGLAKQTVLVALAHAFAASGPALERSVAVGASDAAAAASDEEASVVSDSDAAAASDDDDVVVSSKGKKKGAAAASSSKKGGKAAKSDAKGSASAMESWLGVSSSSSSSSSSSAVAAGGNGSGPVASGPSETGLKALGDAVLAALEQQGVAVQEYHLSTKTKAAVDSPKAKVNASALVFRRGLSAAVNAAAPTAVKQTLSAAGAGASSAGVGSAAGVTAIPAAVIDWKSSLGLNAEKAAARNDAAVAVLKQVYSELPNFEIMLPSLLSGGLVGALEACSLTGGVPVSPMLAKPTRGVREVLDRFEGVSFTCEYKYDGERAQVHVPEAGVASVFSRNSENTSGKYPDIAIHIREAMVKEASVAEVTEEVEVPSPAAAAEASSSSSSSSAAMDVDAATPAAPAATTTTTSKTRTVYKFPVTSCVLDGEVVAYDRDKDALMPFQVLSTRARKDVTVDSVKVQVVYAAFDLLLVNGVSLLHVPLRTRRALLRMFFQEIPGKFCFAQSSDSSDVEEISAFLNESVKGGCEGLMVKVLDGPESVYEPSKRSLNWLKLKKDYMDGLTDSFDLVPIAAWKGKGKRTGVYGAYLLACYDPDEEVYQAITKIGTGFSDEMLQELTQAMDSKDGCRRATKPSNVLVGDALLDADVWFDPDASEVWEVKAADLSISPVHMAALGRLNAEKGVALRFPRFIRRRDDKGPADATNAEQVETMYRAQSATVVSKGGAGDDDDDW